MSLGKRSWIRCKRDRIYSHAPGDVRVRGGCLRGSTGLGQTLYPLDRAEILAGARFHLNVEFEGLVAPDEVTLTVNGIDHA